MAKKPGKTPGGDGQMDLTGSLYGIFGTSDPLYLAIAGLVALLLAGSLSAAVLEAVRIYGEYRVEPARAEPETKPLLPPEQAKPAPEAGKETAPAPEQAPEKVSITGLGEVATQAPPPAPAKPEQPVRPPPTPQPAAVPRGEVVKGTLPESMKAVTAKYGLDWLTIASMDGLVIASTGATPDEDAAVYSNLFQELCRTRPETYFNVSNKDVHLLLVESGSYRFIDIARKPGTMAKDEVAGLREDSRRIVERFVWGSKKS